MRRTGLRSIALVYLLVVLLGPLSMVFWKTFEHGFSPFWHALSAPETATAFKNTLIVTAIAVPLNTIFGVVCESVSAFQNAPKPWSNVFQKSIESGPRRTTSR